MVRNDGVTNFELNLFYIVPQLFLKIAQVGEQTRDLFISLILSNKSSALQLHHPISSPLFYDPQIGEIGHGQKLISSHFVTRFVARIFNKVPSDVNTSLDGSTYPKNTWVVLAC